MVTDQEENEHTQAQTHTTERRRGVKENSDLFSGLVVYLYRYVVLI